MVNGSDKIAIKRTKQICMALKGYVSNRDGEVRTGPHVDELLTKIEDLENATQRTDGTMSASDKAKLDSLEDDEELSVEEINSLLNF